MKTIDTTGTSKWVKNLVAIGGLVTTMLGMMAGFAAYFPEIQTEIFHRQKDTLSIDQQEAIFSAKAEKQIQEMIAKSFSGKVDSNAQRINMLFDFINRPGSQLCAIGIRANAASDSLWYRDTRCQQHDCWVDESFQWWKYYDNNDREFKAAYFEEKWDEFKMKRALMLMTILKPID